MESDLAKILIPRERIQQRVQEMGRDIARVYGDQSGELVIAAILSGSIIFLADLI